MSEKIYTMGDGLKYKVTVVPAEDDTHRLILCGVDIIFNKLLQNELIIGGLQFSRADAKHLAAFILDHGAVPPGWVSVEAVQEKVKGVIREYRDTPCGDAAQATQWRALRNWIINGCPSGEGE